MCTLSWDFCGNGYTIFFNRDELNTRTPATPPRKQLIQGVEVLAPQDGEKGGSWIAVNEFGVLTCLLNLYEHSFLEPSVPFLGRGHLVMDLATRRDWVSSQPILEKKNLERYPPFQLFQFAPGVPVNCLKWNGETFETFQFDQCRQPISGSSFRNHDVVGQRIETFKKLVTPESQGAGRLRQLETFHLSHDVDQGAYSVNMCRPDAQTISFSRVDVNSETIRFRYQKKDSRGFEFDSPLFITLDRRLTTL
jgi:hypothetical protein